MSSVNEVEARVMNVVLDAIRKLNLELQYDNLEQPTRETELWGSVDGIDSLSLVNLAVDLENRVSGEFDGSVSLTDEDALATETSPFRSVGTLTDYIAAKLLGNAPA